jgi:hypothetical protein
MTSYPKFSVSGVELNSAQCMTIWTALQSFAIDMKENGLGDDEHGKIMADAYRKRVIEINEICYSVTP